jgi:FkbM family methyltransferase
MIKSLKKLIQALLSLFNLRLQFIRDYSTSSTLASLNISLVIDVGANTGQFGSEIREKGYLDSIYSFEPLIEAHKVLLRNTTRDKKWKIHPRCAIGDFVGEIDINVAGNSYSSSIKEMLPSHISAAPDSTPIGSHKADIITLDSLLDTWKNHKGNIFLKIDTQGFELEVLRGASETLKLVTAVQLELSIIELYEDQALYGYFFNFFESRGFRLYQLIPGFLDPKDGQLLQFDAIFKKMD